MPDARYRILDKCGKIEDFLIIFSCLWLLISDLRTVGGSPDPDKTMMKTSILKIKIILSLAVALILSFASCTSVKREKRITPDGKKILTFWHTMNREETETLISLIEEFEKENPDVKIQPQPVPFDQAQNKFKITAQAGDAPDVFRSEIAWTCEEAALGYLLILDDYVSREDRQDYLQAPLRYNLYQGHIYGIPQVTDCLALLYNKRMFKEAGVEPPATMEQFREIGKKLTIDENGRNANDPSFDPDNIKQYGFYFNGKAYFFQPFMWAFGGGLLNPEKKEILVSNQGTVEAIKFLIKLRDEDHVTPAQFDLKSSYENMMAGFKEGKYAMIMNGPWATTDIFTGDEFTNRENLGVAVIPRGPGGYGSPVGGHNYVIASNTYFPDEAYKFISFLNQPENQARFAIANNLMPTRKSAYQLRGVTDNPILQSFKAQLDLAKNRPVVPQGGLIYNEFDPYFQAAYLGAMSPQQAMDEVAASWEKMMGW